MIHQIWNKKIVAIIQLDPDDSADNQSPLPLVLGLSWNSYLGFYNDTISDFFQMYAPFPLYKEDFHLTFEQSKERLPNQIIIYHLIELFSLSLAQPLRLKCHFRSKERRKEFDLRKVYKNSLKASTALKYGKYGAARLTVEMSINNVDQMFKNFQEGKLQAFLGSENFESEDLGHLFLIHKSERIAVKFLHKDITIERSCSKEVTLQQFTQQTFGATLSKSLRPKIYLVELLDQSIGMSVLQKYCHPDGYLYIHL